MSKYLIVGASGIIGEHLIARLLNEKNYIKAEDKKSLDLWFQKFDNVKNFSFAVGSKKSIGSQKCLSLLGLYKIRQRLA